VSVADAELGEAFALLLDIDLRSRVASGLDGDQMGGAPSGKKFLDLSLDFGVDFFSDALTVDKLGAVRKSHKGQQFARSELSGQAGSRQIFRETLQR
jgi:hypothetical protein